MTEDKLEQSQAAKYPQRICPRRPGIALALSVCPGLGQQYAGHLVRGIIAYAALIMASWLAAAAFMFVESRLSILLLATPFAGMALIAIDAYRCAQKQPINYRIQWFNKAWLYPAVFLTLLFTVNPLMDLLVGDKIVRAFFVPTESMAPSVLKHDVVLINKLASPKKGDIVLVDLSKGQGVKKATKIIKDRIIRRIIAMPGETVEITGKEVLVNGAPLNEPYARFIKGSSHDIFITEDYSLGPEKVPPDSFFVLSDARNFGLDSRVLGFISDDRIGGVATKIFWSWNLDEGNFIWHRTAMSLR